MHERAMPGVGRPSVRAVWALLLLGWVGLYLHNVADLPHLTLASPENSVTGLIYVALGLAWWLLPAPRLVGALILAWGLFNLVVGAIVSVLPLAILPFEPAQTLLHYTMHVVYGVTQLPLIALAARILRPGH